jgi:hypothetical protein
MQLLQIACLYTVYYKGYQPHLFLALSIFWHSSPIYGLWLTIFRTFSKDFTNIPIVYDALIPRNDMASVSKINLFLLFHIPMPHQSLIFNYIHVLQDLSIGDLKAKPPDLSYQNSPFKYSPTSIFLFIPTYRHRLEKHVVTNI